MDVVEASKEIRRAVDTGEVLFGVKQAQYALRHGQGKLLVMARNTPLSTQETIRNLTTLGETPLYAFAGTGLELGSVCGKPYVVSTLLIMDEGKSKVLDITQASTEEEAKPKRKGRKKKEE